MQCCVVELVLQEGRGVQQQVFRYHGGVEDGGNGGVGQVEGILGASHRGERQLLGRPSSSQEFANHNSDVVAEGRQEAHHHTLRTDRPMETVTTLNVFKINQKFGHLCVQQQQQQQQQQQHHQQQQQHLQQHYCYFSENVSPQETVIALYTSVSVLSCVKHFTTK